eukprot:TRINITY_DN754_c0_g1_i1.p1 TRINITY_DN754_c0_g1~~TRINITY_DN754_c0_g1_i1.p1  ORF type:complete len:456 (-),score=62.65 TRINITY_DN754_c0_g1_i1:91-1458(-)
MMDRKDDSDRKRKRDALSQDSKDSSTPLKKRRGDEHQASYFDAGPSRMFMPDTDDLDSQTIQSTTDIHVLINLMGRQRQEIQQLRSEVTQLAQYIEIVGAAAGVRSNESQLQSGPTGSWTPDQTPEKNLHLSGVGYPRILWQKKAAIKLVKELYLRQSRSGNGVEQFLRKFFLLHGDDVETPKAWKRTLARMKTNFRKEKQYFVERLRKYFNEHHEALKLKILSDDDAKKLVTMSLASWDEAASMDWKFVALDTKEVETIWDRKDPTIGMHVVASAILGCCVRDPNISKTKGPTSQFFKILKQLDVITLREQIKQEHIRRVFEDCGFSVNTTPSLDNLVAMPKRDTGYNQRSSLNNSSSQQDSSIAEPFGQDFQSRDDTLKFTSSPANGTNPAHQEPRTLTATTPAELPPAGLSIPTRSITAKYLRITESSFAGTLSSSANVYYFCPKRYRPNSA